MREVREEAHSRSLEEGAEAAAWMRWMSTVQLALWACPTGFLIHPGLVAQGQHHPLFPEPPTSIINQENALQSCLQASLMEVVVQLRFPLPTHTCVCINIKPTSISPSLITNMAPG